jgi:hypothetical protein
MSHMRLLSLGPVLAAVLLMSAAPAMAAATPATAGSAAQSSPARPAASARHALSGRPAAATARPEASAGSVNDQLGSDSCTPLNNGSASHYTCMATGWFVEPGSVQPLALTQNQGTPWGGTGTVADAENNNVVNLPNEVSCATPDGLRPTCMMVGEHFSNPATRIQLAEVWDGGWTVISGKNPLGSTWSSLQDVACPKITFCMMVGQAGTSRKTSRGIVYSSHATAYRWNGTTVTRLTVPGPAKGHDAELAGLACATSTNCLAVGNYRNAQNQWRAYSAAWANGKWQLESARNLGGEALTTFNAVSCTSATTCMAAGVAQTPGSHPFAESWRNGTWRFTAMPARNSAGLVGVSCPVAGRCFAAGWSGNRGLIEAWNGSRWTVQSSPATLGAFSADSLMHVSCVTAAECVAVGYRFNPKVKVSNRTFTTLAQTWNGHSWQTQPTANQ